MQMQAMTFQLHSQQMALGSNAVASPAVPPFIGFNAASVSTNQMSQTQQTPAAAPPLPLVMPMEAQAQAVMQPLPTPPSVLGAAPPMPSMMPTEAAALAAMQHWQAPPSVPANAVLPTAGAVAAPMMPGSAVVQAPVGTPLPTESAAVATMQSLPAPSPLPGLGTPAMITMAMPMSSTPKVHAAQQALRASSSRGQEAAAVPNMMAVMSMNVQSPQEMALMQHLQATGVREHLKVKAMTAQMPAPPQIRAALTETSSTMKCATSPQPEQRSASSHAVPTSMTAPEPRARRPPSTVGASRVMPSEREDQVCKLCLKPVPGCQDREGVVRCDVCIAKFEQELEWNGTEVLKERMSANAAAKPGRNKRQQTLKITGQDSEYRILSMTRFYEVTMDIEYTLLARVVSSKWKQLHEHHCAIVDYRIDNKCGDQGKYVNDILHYTCVCDRGFKVAMMDGTEETCEQVDECMMLGDPRLVPADPCWSYCATCHRRWPRHSRYNCPWCPEKYMCWDCYFEHVLVCPNKPRTGFRRSVEGGDAKKVERSETDATPLVFTEEAMYTCEFSG